MQFACLIAVAFSFNANAERMSITNVKEFPTAVVNFPPVDTDANAEVGESIVSAILKGRKPAIKLLEKIEGFKVALVFGAATVNIAART